MDKLDKSEIVINSLIDFIIVMFCNICLAYSVLILQPDKISPILVNIKFIAIILTLFLLTYFIIKPDYLFNIKRLKNTVIYNVASNSMKISFFLVAVIAIYFIFYMSKYILFLEEFYDSISAPMVSLYLSILFLLITLRYHTAKEIIGKCTKELTFQFPLDDNALNDEELCQHNKVLVQNLINLVKNTEENKNYLSIAINGGWGIGKTTIMNSLEYDEDFKRKYHIISINFWQAKDPKDIVLEIERQINEFFKSCFYGSNLKTESFFKSVAGLYDSKITNLIDLFITNEPESLKASKEGINKKIEDALKASNKKKIIILFDDIDRVIDVERIYFFLKIITYVVKFNNIVTITGIELEKMLKLLYPSFSKSTIIYTRSLDDDKNEFASNYYTNALKPDIGHKNEVFREIRNNEWDDYIYKVFSNIYDLQPSIIPPDIKKQAKKILFEDRYLSEGKELCYLHYFLNYYGFNDVDKNVIYMHISAFVNTGLFYEVFENFRELKLSLNEFLSKLLIMRSGTECIITNKISPIPLFILSVIKIINPCFFYSFIRYCKVHKNKHFNIEKYFEMELSNDENSISNKLRLSKLLRIIDVTKEKGIKTDIIDTLFVKLNSESDFNAPIGPVQYNINTASVMRYYIVPYTYDYQFEYESLCKHFVEIGKKKNCDEIVRNIFTKDGAKTKYFSTEEYLYEYREMIYDYLDNYWKFVKQNLNTKELLNEMYHSSNKIFLSLSHIIFTNKNHPSLKKYGYELSSLVDLFEPNESFSIEFDKKHFNLYAIDDDYKDTVLKFSEISWNLNYQIGSFQWGETIENEPPSHNLLILNLIPLVYGRKYSYLIQDINELLVIDRVAYDKLKLILDSQKSVELRFLSLTLLNIRLDVMDKMRNTNIDGKPVISDEVLLEFNEYYRFLFEEFYTQIGQINFNELENLKIVYIKSLLTTAIDIDKRFNNFHITFSPEFQSQFVQILNHIKDHSSVLGIVKTILGNNYIELPAQITKKFSDNTNENIDEIIYFIENYMDSIKRSIIDEWQKYINALNKLKDYNEKLKKKCELKKLMRLLVLRGRDNAVMEENS